MINTSKKLIGIFIISFLFTACFKQDNTPPVISLSGSSEIFIEIGNEYTEPGFIAEDDKDGDITRLVKVTGLPNTDRAGRYNILYNVVDASGNDATEKSRNVYVYHVNNSISGTFNTVSQCLSGNNNFTLIKTINNEPFKISVELPASSNFTEFSADMIGPSRQAISVNFEKGDTLYFGEGSVNGIGNEISLRLYKEYQSAVIDSCVLGLFKSN